ncbi:hypothetical protein EK21DRAFT_112242 [Setomelanomma holmii]|uniref:Uncharacterized protein n=1 Tax=Setomelanomma holmii TaxID=210430 RepID=A0A9P4LME0_9PLEO|nr:hypothetical protein EK21DRAFT_112242 [Setomelanomma holmii]
MADALCGPSNALQNFQKHTTVDRTLQQDRLVGRHSPSQGFRSSSGRNAGALDSEFDAFQAGRPGAIQQDFHHPSPQFAHHPPPPQFAQSSQAPGWAADFQRLNISSSPVQPLQRQQPQAANAAPSWHQDFLMQQGAAVQAPARQQQQNTYGAMSRYSMGGFGGQSFMQTPTFQNAPVSQTAQGKQPVQEAGFDEAAFEQAFLQAEQEAQQDMLDLKAEQSRAQAAQANPEVMGCDRPGEMDPLLIRIRETRPAVYSAIQVWSETGLGRTEEAVTYLENMAHLEQSGKLVEDANEAKWVVDSLQRIVNRDAPQEVRTRAESLITAINERLMSQYPLGAKLPVSEEQIWKELEAAGYLRTPPHERTEQQPEQQEEEEEEEKKKKKKKKKKPQMNDEDEMAATAGRLLERVAHDTSEKFQNSQFLELMRRLRDREVRVDDDKIVEINDQTSAPQQASRPDDSQIPPVDATILSHAAIDFEMPLYEDPDQNQQYAANPVTGEPIPITDEISEQFRAYNVKGTYHR